MGFVGVAQIQRGDQLIIPGAGGLVPPNSASVGGLSAYNYSASDETQVDLDLGFSYGYALLDRLVVGADINVGVGHAGGIFSNYRLDPFARYYVVNRPGLGVFGQVGTRFSDYGGNAGGSSVLEQLTLQTGLQLPIAAGLFLTPTIAYAAQKGDNEVTLGAGLQLLLHPGTTDEAITGNFGKGTITLGGQSVSLAARDGRIQGGLSVGGQYFLTDRLAAGVQLGVGGVRYALQNSDPEGLQSQHGGNVDIGGSARYYLSAPRRLVWFLDAGAGYAVNWQSRPVWENFGTATQRLVAQKDRSSMGYLAAGGGAQYFIRKNIALEAAPQFRYGLKEDAFYGRTRFAVNFGFRVML